MVSQAGMTGRSQISRNEMPAMVRARRQIANGG